MRGTGRVILGIFGFCSLVTFYVHLQVVTFLASYEIHRTSEKIYSASEQFRKLKFESERLKAPHRLEGRIREYEMNLALPEMVYRVPHAFLSQASQTALLSESTKSIGAPQLLKQVFSNWVQVAHAKNDTSDS